MLPTEQEQLFAIRRGAAAAVVPYILLLQVFVAHSRLEGIGHFESA
jgi:hypothetical protein